MNVIPIATQPTKEIEVNNEKMLSGDKKPGVVSAQARMAIAPSVRMSVSVLISRKRKLPPFGGTAFAGD
jgi:hypothetical protein